MVKKVLPPLNEQNQVPNIATSGEWKAEDATFLEKLAKGLKMGGEEIVSSTSGEEPSEINLSKAGPKGLNIIFTMIRIATVRPKRPNLNFNQFSKIK